MCITICAVADSGNMLFELLLISLLQKQKKALSIEISFLESALIMHYSIDSTLFTQKRMHYHAYSYNFL